MHDPPIHPWLVHLPLGAAMLAPLGLAWVARELDLGRLPARAWWLVVVLSAVVPLAGTATWLSGQDEAERLRHTVETALLFEHREAALTFLCASLAPVTAGLAAGVWLTERGRRVARWLAVALAVVTLATGLAAGRAGGQIAWVGMRTAPVLP
jgi:uncharacterized membrane protein